jgi:tripeptide aminopeptidase
MVNAIRGLSLLLSELPRDRMSPEATDERDGFIHPYSIRGDVAQAEAKMLLRDFVTDKLDDYDGCVRAIANRVASNFPGLQFEISRTRQYRNMADYVRREPLVVQLAQLAYERIGLDGHLGSIRGGTDGAMLSEMGLPTPNLSVGEHNIHSVLEFTSLNEIAQAVEHAVVLLDLWQAHGRT